MAAGAKVVDKDPAKGEAMIAFGKMKLVDINAERLLGITWVRSAGYSMPADRREECRCTGVDAAEVYDWADCCGGAEGSEGAGIGRENIQDFVQARSHKYGA